jgi:hypothetical protein
MRSNDGRGVRLGGRIELWEGAFEGVRVLGTMEEGSGACGTGGACSLRIDDDALGRPVTGTCAVD